MSTKIHNGYKLNIKFDELIPFCIKTRSELEIIKKQLYMKTVTTRLTNRKDRNLLLNKDTNIFKESMKEIKEDADEMAKGIISSWGLDFQAEAVFYLDGEDVYATFHCDCTEIINYWQSLPIVLDYHYQNQTDKPSNISSQNWEKRSQIWKKLLKGISFAENGLSYSFTGLKNTYFLSWLAEYYIPYSKEDRANAIVSDLLFADVANKETFINSQEAVSSYMDFIRWVKTDEGKASRNKKIEEILSKIPNEYTLKELCE